MSTPEGPSPDASPQVPKFFRHTVAEMDRLNNEVRAKQEQIDALAEQLYDSNQMLCALVWKFGRGDEVILYQEELQSVPKKGVLHVKTDEARRGIVLELKETE
jgi:hypothetical protein